MIDKTPYIIVDNQKIAPIRPASKTNQTSAERSNREDQPFGVVDRVTISDDALQKYRQLQTPADADPSLLPPPSRKVSIPSLTLLTDASKKHR
jgi:hypothetical protein